MALARMVTVLLLHLSDIHFRAPNCDDPNLDPDRPVRTLMLQDIRARVAELGPLGAILIGGDIAFQGVPQEYEIALRWVGELVAAASCRSEQVFMIPGNHDVDRTIVRRTETVQSAQAAIAAADPDRREHEFRTRIFDEETAPSLLAPLTAYNDFAKDFNCQVYLPDRLYWKQDIQLEEDVVLRLHGLTSTFLSGTNGVDDTRGRLYLSPLQTVLDPQDNVVNLVLSHHPPDWFMDHDDADEAICSRAAIHMFGHKHRQRITREADYIRFAAGAVNPARNELGWQPGYNLIDVHVTGTGADRMLVIAAYLRQFQSNPDQFRALLTRHDEDIFRHSIRFPDRRSAYAPTRAWVQESATAPTESATPSAEVAAKPPQPDPDVEAAMGNADTRNLVFRFWNLTSSQRREIMLRLQLISPEEIRLPEPERYGRGLIRAGERKKLLDLAREVERKETA